MFKMVAEVGALSVRCTSEQSMPSTTVGVEDQVAFFIGADTRDCRGRSPELGGVHHRAGGRAGRFQADFLDEGDAVAVRKFC